MDGVSLSCSQIVLSAELNLQLTEEDTALLQSYLTPDATGMIAYTEFVTSARSLLVTIYQNRPDAEVCDELNPSSLTLPTPSLPPVHLLPFTQLFSRPPLPLSFPITHSCSLPQSQWVEVRGVDGTTVMLNKKTGAVR